jgi:hypothetical protein
MAPPADPWPLKLGPLKLGKGPGGGGGVILEVTMTRPNRGGAGWRPGAYGRWRKAPPPSTPAGAVWFRGQGMVLAFLDRWQRR